MATRDKSIGRGARDRARDALEESLHQLERQLPKNLSRMVRQLRANLKALQQQVERLRQERDVRWERIQTQVRRDAARLFRRLEKAIEPKATRKAQPARKGGARKRSAAAPAAAKSTRGGPAARLSQQVTSAARAASRALPLAAAPRSTAESRAIGEPPGGDA